MPPSTRQTQSFLMRRFQEVGIRPHSRLGQNFLIDLNLQQLIVDAAEVGPDDVVLEIGTGTGALTALVAPRVAAMVTVEVDPQLHALAADELDGLANVTMLQTDALRSKSRLSPVVLDTVNERLAAVPGRQFKVVANLPFSVATPLIGNLLALDRPPATMTVTIQKELADRIMARPSTKDYGALSIWVQSQCRTELVRVLGPSVFWPRPKVHSAVIKIVFDEALRRKIPDREFFHAFARSMFCHRRKFLRSELLAAMKNRLDKPGVDRILAELGLGADARAEQLSVEQMLTLCEAVRAAAAS